MTRIVFFLIVFGGIPACAVTYEQVQPILARHCQSCHRTGEIGPMPLTTYREVRPWAAAIREAVKLRRMPPWFADPKHGEFANDARLRPEEVERVDAWVRGGAPEGKRVTTADLPSQRITPDLSITAPTSFRIPANSVIDYQYIIIPLPFKDERWVRGVEIRPRDRSVVHHAVLYVREPGADWLRDVKPGVFYASPGSNSELVARTRDTQQDILAIYTPGARAMECPNGMAKKIPAGSDLVLQVHYTSKKVSTTDRPTIHLVFAKQQPAKRILTLQMGRDDLRIPPGDANYRASVTGTLPNEALLISLFPHMHLRGSAFEYEVIASDGRVETLLRVKPYDFDWQLNYVLKTPRLLPKGTRLRWTGYFDNSRNNPRNPDPTQEVTWGEQSWDEMMIGFFDVAVDIEIDKQRFFIR